MLFCSPAEIWTRRSKKKNRELTKTIVLVSSRISLPSFNDRTSKPFALNLASRQEERLQFQKSAKWAPYCLQDLRDSLCNSGEELDGSQRGERDFIEPQARRRPLVHIGPGECRCLEAGPCQRLQGQCRHLGGPHLP